jgi:hypothetical protein
MRLSGTIPLVARLSLSEQRGAVALDNRDEMIEVLYLALVQRGLAVAKGSNYDWFDLRIAVAPFLRIAVLFLTSGNGVSLGWRTGAAGSRVAATTTILLVMLLVGGISLPIAIAICGLAIAVLAALALRRAWRVPAVICKASAELAAQSEFATTAEPATRASGRASS